MHSATIGLVARALEHDRGAVQLALRRLAANTTTYPHYLLRRDAYRVDLCNLVLVTHFPLHFDDSAGTISADEYEVICVTSLLFVQRAGTVVDMRIHVAISLHDSFEIIWVQGDDGVVS